jgi:hypothetical protein
MHVQVIDIDAEVLEPFVRRRRLIVYLKVVGVKIDRNDHSLCAWVGLDQLPTEAARVRAKSNENP